MAEPTRTRKPPQWALRASAPVALALAGRRSFPLWAIVHHRGRRSGAEYDTPVAIVPTVASEVILIGLPWGPKTEWARNVLAADGAILKWKGREVPAIEPRLVGPAEAAALAAPPFRSVTRRFPVAIVLERK